MIKKQLIHYSERETHFRGKAVGNISQWYEDLDVCSYNLLSYHVQLLGLEPWHSLFQNFEKTYSNGLQLQIQVFSQFFSVVMIFLRLELFSIHAYGGGR